MVPPGFERADLGTGFGVGFGPVWSDRSRRTIGFRVTPHHPNATGACHGGAMATFADAQLIAIQAGPEEGGLHTSTISLDLTFLAPIVEDRWVEAEVTLLRRTRSLLFTHAVMSVDGEPVGRSAAVNRNRLPSGERR